MPALRRRVGFYLCCFPQAPNTFVSSPLEETRLLAYCAHMLRVQGVLRWSFCLWPGDPWPSPPARTHGGGIVRPDLEWSTDPAAPWRVGDMYLVLPGRDGPSFAYSLPVRSFRTRRDRVASFD